MGRDNHPRIRQKKALARKRANRAGYDRILVVCEGTKTEPEYFKEIRQFYRLNTANICVIPSNYGTSPQQVVEFARDKCLETRQWEKVYCVFDRDEHPSFEGALQIASKTDKKIKNDLKKPIRFIAIKSIPCFEIWLLLHFEYLSRHVDSTQVLALLRRDGCISGYDKGRGGYFNMTRHLLETAYSNTDRLKTEQKRHDRDNPYTDIDILVKQLTNMKI